MGQDHLDLNAAVDTRLEEALANANFRITLNNQRNNLLLKLNRNLVYSIGGGMFDITPELISLAATLMSRCDPDTAETVLLDKNKTPIEISNLEEFLDDIVNQYHEAMYEYLVEFNTIIKKSRTTKALLGE